MAILEQTVWIFLEAYDVQGWGDLIGLDLENKPQWDTYYCDYYHHGEPGHISKNSAGHSSSSNITGYKKPNHNSSQQIHQPWAVVK